MINKFKRFLGPLYPIASVFFVGLLLFSLSRLGLALWHLDRVNDAHAWYELVVSGIRIDIVSLCYLLILPALLSSLFASDNQLGRFWHLVLRFWITAGLWLIVYMEVVTPPFIIEYDLRPNRLFIEYLIYPKEVASMLWSGYKLEIFVGLVASALTIVIGWKWSGSLVKGLSYPPWYWRPLIGLLVVAIGVLGARSSLGHRPLNPAMVAFSSDPLINDLVLNSSFSVIFAAKQMKSEASALDLYPPMPSQEVVEQVRSGMNVAADDFISLDFPSLAKRQAQYQGKPKNIVILLLESHGARYVSRLGGIDISPSIDNLIDEGWAFTRAYATGTRSVRGIEAVSTGFAPTPARSVVKLGKSQTNFFSIADLLKSNGYHTQFIYGGESHFDNMKSFFLGNGFVDMQDFPTFNEPTFVGSWGASDEDLYQKADEQFTQLSHRNQPFFSLVFSSSNHSPYEYPENRITPYNQPKDTVENAVKYADFALGQFIEKAKKSTYWQDTIFLIIADHDARTYGNQAVPIDYFRIPAIILGGGVEAKIDDRLISQIDLPPTLLSLAGISSQHPMIGHDLTHEVPVDKQRIMVQRQENYGYMTADNQVVVIRPEQGVSTYQYDPVSKALISKALEPALIKKAHAHALWGSLAFKENWYQALDNYALSAEQ